MKIFEKCTVAMLVGPCSQHVTGNTSWQNQSQSAIMIGKYLNTAVPFKHLKVPAVQSLINANSITQIQWTLKTGTLPKLLFEKNL